VVQPRADSCDFTAAPTIATARAFAELMAGFVGFADHPPFLGSSDRDFLNLLRFFNNNLRLAGLAILA
jgi:hypothetical protein